jgi:hypothetical protein
MMLPVHDVVNAFTSDEALDEVNLFSIVGEPVTVDVDESSHDDNLL